MESQPKVKQAWQRDLRRLEDVDISCHVGNQELSIASVPEGYMRRQNLAFKK